MNKKEPIQIISRAVKLYQNHLVNKQVMFIYGRPPDIKQQLQLKPSILKGLGYYEVAFFRRSFLHLTGVVLTENFSTKSSDQFYSKCISGRLSEDDFRFAKDGSSVQKLSILENMMHIKNHAAMIGEFTAFGVGLFTDKVAGGIGGCLGFIKDRKGHNVPNTLLDKDIRNIVKDPIYKIYIIFYKDINQESYCHISKLDKEISLQCYSLGEKIESLLNRTLLEKEL